MSPFLSIYGFLNPVIDEQNDWTSFVATCRTMSERLLSSKRYGNVNVPMRMVSALRTSAKMQKIVDVMAVLMVFPELLLVLLDAVEGIVE